MRYQSTGESAGAANAEAALKGGAKFKPLFPPNFLCYSTLLLLKCRQSPGHYLQPCLANGV
jgi:hypothetical protein